MGNLAGYTYPNGVSSTLQYDGLNRLTNLASNANGVPVASYAYTLGASGNRTGVTELNGRMVSYGYDNLYRLTSETIANDASGLNGAVGYAYDTVGNRKSMSSTLAARPAGLWNYDANDRLTTDTYDNNGNTTWSAGTQDTYDFENHLASHGYITYIYDGDGNRVAKTIGGVTTNYLVDTLNPTGYAQVLDEVQSSSVARNYAWGLQLVSESQPVSNTWTTNYYGFDGHGSVRFLTDSTGAVTDTYDYDAFGNLINSTGSTANNYRFAGEQYDPDINLYYNRARYLDVRVGRFWGMDTLIGDLNSPMSLHKYLYASDNPVNKTDPSGHIGLFDRMIAGQRVHTAIGEDFLEKTGGYSNTSISRIISYLFQIGNGVYLRPDLVDPSTRQVYEIKTVKGAAAGYLQLENYIEELNEATPLDPVLGPWHAGTTYIPRQEFPNVYLQYDAYVDPPVDGVITYTLQGESGGNPGLIGLVAVALAASTVALGTDLAASALAY